MKERDLQILKSYVKYHGRTLEQCYNNPSTAKISAYNAIRREMIENNGDCLTVLSYNTFMFTCAYTYIDGNNDWWLVYHTPNNKRLILMIDKR